MPHFRVEDALHSHPKARQAGLEAMGLWSMCGSYSMGYLTDGFVPEWYVKTWPKGAALAKKLVTARMWTPAQRDDENGWQFHEFTGPGRNDSRAQIEESREKWRKKKTGQRNESPPLSPGDTPGESPGDTPPLSPGDTPGESPGGSLRVTRDPTQHKEKRDPSGYVGLSATDPNARGISATPGAEIVGQLVSTEHPAAVRASLRVHASALIRAGHPRADVAAAVQLWLTKPSLGPNALPSVLSEVVKARAMPNGNGRPPESKQRGWAELAQEVREAEQEQARKAIER